ncbi:MAG: DNA-processing protein DprA [Ktedonobacteraceae bacterium]
MFDASTHYYQSEALSLDELAYWVAFSRILGIGPIRFKLLLDYFHEDVAAAWKAGSKELAQAGLDARTIDGFLKQRTTINPHQELEKLERLRISVITLKDKDYPQLLTEIINAPPVLYIAGTFKKEDDRFALGVVGTRKVSSYGRQVTEQFARELAEGRVTVVSGLAHGIDTIAHTATLDAAIFYSPSRYERSFADIVTGAGFQLMRVGPLLLAASFVSLPFRSFSETARPDGGLHR